MFFSNSEDLSINFNLSYDIFKWYTKLSLNCHQLNYNRKSPFLSTRNIITLLGFVHLDCKIHYSQVLLFVEEKLASFINGGELIF